MATLVYEADLPALPSPVGDITAQRFSASHSGGEPEAQTLDLSADVATFKVPQDVDVHLELRYVDDAGNVSEPSVQDFHSNDTIPPDAPGAFGAIRLVGEE